MPHNHGRIPCTIVTGFLGSGETTLIRNVQERPAGRRFALIINEFGDVGIDGEILEACGVAARSSCICPDAAAAR